MKTARKDNMEVPVMNERILLSWVLQKHKVVKAWDRLNWLPVKVIHCVLFSSKPEVHLINIRISVPS
jgi:hypothetical protein